MSSFLEAFMEVILITGGSREIGQGIVRRFCHGENRAYEYGFRGPRYLFSTACSASLRPVIWASRVIGQGHIDVSVIGGTDPLRLISMAGYSSLQSLAKISTSPFSVTWQRAGDRGEIREAPIPREALLKALDFVIAAKEIPNPEKALCAEWKGRVPAQEAKL
jgi:hypothetical protein